MEQQKIMNSLEEGEEEGFTFSDNKTFYRAKVN